MTEVRTPVAGFSGVVAGVMFANGVGESDNATALAYFKRHGYQFIAPKPMPAKKAAAKKAASKPSEK